MHYTDSTERANRVGTGQESISGKHAENGSIASATTSRSWEHRPSYVAGSDWYKDAIIYELHVRAFYDSNGDGVGDFPGLTQKLDYLQNLGVTAIWLLPFYPSPLQDDGYDIADYKGVHPAYGTFQEFKVFLDEAHRRGLRVITELVLNHTSDRHPWFQRARRAEPGSPERDFYVWSDTPDRFSDARVIFKDYESSNWTWDPVAQAYYWHRFYSHQPDLNYHNPLVQDAIVDVVDFWLEMGVDGLRLDAVPYLYEQDGTTGENLPQTHAFLRALRAHIDERYPNRMLLAEANQWPEEAVSYFGDGDECHMAFHFPLMPRLFMSIRREDCFPVVDIMAQTPALPDCAQWALFLRNHDELTLEMVTDEERVYMYRVYAESPEARINLGIRRRLAPLLRNDRRRMELMNALLFSLPGTPVLYYGDEIGMGDNIYLGDRNGVRTPMQWNADRNAGFSQANPQQLYLPLIVDHEYHHESLQVEAQESNPHSLLNWTRRLIALRKRFRSFGRGSIEFLHPQNRKILAFTRAYQDETVLVVANLSRFVQPVELDLSPFKGAMPAEIFGRVEFPQIGEVPYLLTLGPHAFYWFYLQPSQPDKLGEAGRNTRNGEYAKRGAIPEITIAKNWESLLLGKARDLLADALPDYLHNCRWFCGRAYRTLSARISSATPIKTRNGTVYMCLVRVDYTHHDPETYVLPLAFATGDEARVLIDTHPQSVVARINCTGSAGEDEHTPGETSGSVRDGVLYDGMWNSDFVYALVDLIGNAQNPPGPTGISNDLVGKAAGAPVRREAGSEAAVDPVASVIDRDEDHARIVEGDLNNTSVAFGDKAILKLFRSVDNGQNPEVEIGEYLTRRQFKHAAQLLGSLWYRHGRGSSTALASLERFVPNQGTAWDIAQNELDHYLERVLALGEPAPPATLDAQTLLDEAHRETRAEGSHLLGDFLPAAHLLGQRTTELHTALTKDATDADFRPVPFSSYSQRSLYQAARRQLLETIYALRNLPGEVPGVSPEVRAKAQSIIDLEPLLLERLGSILHHKVMAVAARHHGDLRLSQVLRANNDFVFVDFEGETHRLMAERRLKQSPLSDVASMIYSFHAAAWFALLKRDRAVQAERGGHGGGAGQRQGSHGQPAAWCNYWAQQVSVEFLRGYIAGTPPGAGYLPQDPGDQLVLLDTLMLQRFLVQLEQALSTRQESAEAALEGLLQALGPRSQDRNEVAD